MKKQCTYPYLVRTLSAANIFILALGLNVASAQSGLNLLGYWDFNDASAPDTAKDSVKGYIGLLENGAAFTADKGGRTGQAGDRGVDFGTDTGNRDVLVTDIATAFNEAAANDKITVSYWIKWNVAVANSSAFWFTSPSSSGTQRGFHGHTPYGNGTVYFDTAGCCTATTQRLNGTPAGVNWQQWHHFAFVKDGGAKHVYMDGRRILTQASGANPLPTDFEQFVIGRDFSNQNNIRAIVDDFAIFGSALNSVAVSALSIGIAPGKVESEIGDSDSDGLPNLYENQNGLNPNDKADAALDSDNDGLTNLQEYQKGTNPKNADTDGDGLKDGVETGGGTWVSATNTGTDPLNPDMDGDGLLDGVETNTKVFVSATNTGTSPHLLDTDGDKYADGAEVALKSSPVDAASTPSLGTGIKMLAYWDFNNTSVSTQAVDSVHGLKGNFFNGVVYTEDKGGFSGKAGDRSVDFGTNTAGRAVRSLEIAPWLQAAAVGDQLTLSYWQKWSTPPVNSSMFWIASPSSSGSSRGFQGHVPYGNGNVYFDSAGCCTATTQRLFANISTFGDGQLDFEQWHHVIYVKNAGAKQVWIDGQLFLDQPDGANPLPTDFSELVLGLDYSNPGNQFRGWIDDVALFASALDQKTIEDLAKGTISPSSFAPAPVAQFSIKSAVFNTTTQSLSITWDSQAGKKYAVQRSANLKDWTTLSTVDGNAGTTTFSDPGVSTGTKTWFYRIQLQ